VARKYAEQVQAGEIKAILAAKIGEIIKHLHLSQTQASEILGIPQPKLSGMLRSQFRGIRTIVIHQDVT